MVKDDFDLEDNEHALDVGFTLATYGAFIGLSTLLILWGSNTVLTGFETAGIAAGALFWPAAVSIIGWMLFTISAGGALYEIRQKGDNHED